MICPCKGCTDRTITCHGICKGYQEWKAWKEEINKKKRLAKDNRQISRDQEMKYRKKLKGERR